MPATAYHALIPGPRIPPKQWQTFTMHSIPRENMNAMDWGRSNELVAYAFEGFVILCDAAACTRVCVLEASKQDVTAVIWCPWYSNLLAVGDESSRISVWDVAARRELVEFKDWYDVKGKHPILHMRWVASPERPPERRPGGTAKTLEGLFLLTLLKRSLVVLWDLGQTSKVWSKELHNVIHVSLNPQTNSALFLASTGHLQGLADVFDFGTLGEYNIHAIVEDGGILCDAEFAPSPRNMVLAARKRRVELYSPSLNVVLSTVDLPTRTLDITKLTCLENSHEYYFATLHSEGTLCMWGCAGGKSNLNQPDSMEVNFADCTPLSCDIKYVKHGAPAKPYLVCLRSVWPFRCAVLHINGTVMFWDVSLPVSYRKSAPPPHGSPPSWTAQYGMVDSLGDYACSLAVHPEGSFIALGGVSGSLHIYSVNSNVFVSRIEVYGVHKLTIKHITWIGTSSLVCCATRTTGAGKENFVTWVDVPTSQAVQLRKATNETFSIRGISVSRSGKFLLVLCKDNLVEVWCTHFKSMIHLVTHGSAIAGLAWYPSPKEAASSSPAAERFVAVAGDGSYAYYTVSDTTVVKSDASQHKGRPFGTPAALAGLSSVEGCLGAVDTAGNVLVWPTLAGGRPVAGPLSGHRGQVDVFRLCPHSYVQHPKQGDADAQASALRKSSADNTTKTEHALFGDDSDDTAHSSDASPYALTVNTEGELALYELPKATRVAHNNVKRWVVSDADFVPGPAIAVVGTFGFAVLDLMTLSCTAGALAGVGGVPNLRFACLASAEHSDRRTLRSKAVMYTALAVWKDTAPSKQNSVLFSSLNLELMKSLSETCPEKPDFTVADGHATFTRGNAVLTRAALAERYHGDHELEMLWRVAAIHLALPLPAAAIMPSPREPAKEPTQDNLLYRLETDCDAHLTMGTECELCASGSFDMSIFLPKDQLERHVGQILHRVARTLSEVPSANGHDETATARVRLNMLESAVHGLLLTPQDSRTFIGNMYKACTIAAAISPEVYNTTVRTAASAFLSAGLVADFVDLLLTIGEGATACKQLQNCGDWKEAVRVARAHLPSTECEGVLRRYHERLLSWGSPVLSACVLLSLPTGPDLKGVLRILAKAPRAAGAGAILALAVMCSPTLHASGESLWPLFQDAFAVYAAELQAAGLDEIARLYQDLAQASL